MKITGKFFGVSYGRSGNRVHLVVRRESPPSEFVHGFVVNGAWSGLFSTHDVLAGGHLNSLILLWEGDDVPQDYSDALKFVQGEVDAGRGIDKAKLLPVEFGTTTDSKETTMTNENFTGTTVPRADVQNAVKALEPPKSVTAPVTTKVVAKAPVMPTFSEDITEVNDPDYVGFWMSPESLDLFLVVGDRDIRITTQQLNGIASDYNKAKTAAKAFLKAQEAVPVGARVLIVESPDRPNKHPFAEKDVVTITVRDMDSNPKSADDVAYLAVDDDGKTEGWLFRQDFVLVDMAV